MMALHSRAQKLGLKFRVWAHHDGLALQGGGVGELGYELGLGV